MYKVQREDCCTQLCLKKMDLIEMCIVRKNLRGRNNLQLRQYVLDFLWEHARPNDSRNLENMAFFLSGFKLCCTAFKKVIGITENSFDTTTKDFTNGVRELTKTRTRRLSEKRLLTENWMEHYFKVVGDKMPNAGTIHLPSYLDKRAIYKTMSDEMKDKGQQPTHYSVFCKLFHTVFPHVKFPKVL
ncbi:uncharacterized protein LOC110243076 isoform X2 [Exaiptasia diaphana]|uniref:Uncharacterized protein n=1 Tax=Exaiptasia diaphana TaxID=2652724 RepID=A0A913YNJ7_EXADI|nr:uncharacterized protein LOC110243076 isoform X2 [Exaiptasia diaphana]